MPNIHDGHRKRTKQKFHDHGLEGFTDIEALELLLMYALPRRDTNPLAHALLDRFHSFRAVLEADIHDLEAVDGVGPNAATLIALATALNRRYLAAEGKEERTVLNSTEAAAAYLIPKFAYLTEETVILVCLDGASRVIGCHKLDRGGVNSVRLGARDIADIALREHAAGVILAHNHPSGNAYPSGSDLEATGALSQMLRMIDVKLLDHIIVAGTDCVSMRDSQDFKEYLKK